MNILRSFVTAITISTAAVSACHLSAIDFNSSDTAVTNTFVWARDMAMSYVHDGSDPVGLWYEAALPGRDAFCMRDLSHQAIAGSLLGLNPHNLNMFANIARNISQSKDWCSYWEIDRLDRPAPCDYANDKEFWYNLPANFDVVRACYDLYRWTADTTYLTSPEFVNFYQHSLNDYAQSWDLTPDKIMKRRRFMNTPEPFNPKNGFHSCRGLPSYAENFSGITVAIDLIGAAQQAYQAYSQICRLTGKDSIADSARATAQAYSALLDSVWWDSDARHYNTYYKEDNSFHRGEGIPYLLLIRAITDPDKAQASVDDVLSRSWNVENLSAFPAFLYRLGRDSEARDILTSLPTVDRNDYPEVSYGAIEGIFGGLMGIDPDAATRSLETCHHPSDAATVSTATDVPLFGWSINLTHKGFRSSTLTNNTPLTITWHATFNTPSGVKTLTATVRPNQTKTLTAK